MLLNAYLFTLLSVCVLGSKPGGSDTARKFKAGISWPAQEHTSDPVNKFFPAGSHISWSYNWVKDYHTAQLSQTSPGFKMMGEFVPMFWTGTDAKDLNIQEGSTHVMGFNEPDAEGSGVATTLSAIDAVRYWNDFARPLSARGNIKFVSPGVANDVNWLKTFLGNSTLVQPDYIAVHVYAMTLEEVKNKINDYRQFNKKLWITEFCMTTFGGAAPKDQQAVHDFMGQVTEWMDGEPMIERYAWFGALRDPANLHDVHPFNRLMDEKGEITPLGWQYIWGGHK